MKSDAGEKPLDVMKWRRETRNRTYEDTRDMSFEERRRWSEERIRIRSRFSRSCMIAGRRRRRGQAPASAAPGMRHGIPSVKQGSQPSMTALQPHPAYKDSGIDWLEEVPEHWRVLPGRACLTEKRQEQNLGLRETTVLSLSYGNIVVKPAEKLHGLVPTSFETYQIVDPLDIVVRPTDLQNDCNSLKVRSQQVSGRHHECLHVPP